MNKLSKRQDDTMQTEDQLAIENFIEKMKACSETKGGTATIGKGGSVLKKKSLFGFVLLFEKSGAECLLSSIGGIYIG